VDHAVTSIEHTLGCVSTTPEQFAETKTLVEACLRQLQTEHNKASCTSSATLRDALVSRAHWELDPLEIKWLLAEDEVGNLRPIEFGVGVFGVVHQGVRTKVKSTPLTCRLVGLHRSQTVTIKTIPFRTPTDEAAFLDEVAAVGRLSHPNIGLNSL
jgi:hypothetical protein